MCKLVPTAWGWGGGGVRICRAILGGGGGEGVLVEENERGQLLRNKETCGLFTAHEKCKNLKD
jgi:hypothetical protein